MWLNKTTMNTLAILALAVGHFLLWSNIADLNELGYRQSAINALQEKLNKAQSRLNIKMVNKLQPDLTWGKDK